MRVLAGLLVAAVLTASGEPAAAAPRAPEVQVTTDQFSKDVTFLGPQQIINPFGGTIRSYRLRSWVNKETKAVEHQLYVEISYIGSWRWYSTAADDTAQDLPVTRIGSNVSSCSFGCSLSETVGVALSDEALRRRAASGMQIKISARSGDGLIIDLPAPQIGLQLTAIDRYLGVSTAADPAAAVIATPGATLGADLGADFDEVPNYARNPFTRTGGALVTWVKRDSVAARAGIKWADVIVEFGGEPVSGADDLRSRVAATAPGSEVSVKVVRGRKPILLVGRF